MKTVSAETIEILIEKAKRVERKRSHHTIHEDLDDPVQRMIITAQEGTYIRPHKHIKEYQWEMFLVVSGHASMLQFDEEGVVTHREELGDHNNRIVEVKPLVWHTIVITAGPAVLFELKPGPYIPLQEENFAPWSPKEGDEKVQRFEQTMRSIMVGEQLSIA